ncbi:putative glycosyltransferase [metagenome]|uniref:Putative glycosyltransferase n=1 Tax=metagenome TaxID=256318 RepID=A0A2P2C7I4_9ZZZZ
MTTQLRICLIASSRFPVREPFAGGLEAHTHGLVSELSRRGHAVSLFAAPDSDPALDSTHLRVATYRGSATARRDLGAPPELWMQEHHAYLALMLELMSSGSRDFDVIHNNSLHHLPIAMASAVRTPMVTTLHTPPVPWLESALAFAPSHSRFVAVSEATRRSWSHVVDSSTILNGVDTTTWKPGRGGSGAVWSGRIVPEKGPHLAIDAAVAAGLAINLAGPRADPRYFESEIRPRLGTQVTYLGHLAQAELHTLVASSAVAVVSPRWEEPYGLVAAEAMACGTPVAAFARGALPEIVCADTGRLAAADDIDDLRRAIVEASGLDRARTAFVAHERFSLERMADDYERLYRCMLTSDVAA